MQHTLDILLRLHIDEAEVRPGEAPRDTAERLLREIMTVDDKVVDIHDEIAEIAQKLRKDAGFQ
jgi:hypothetical protein